MNTNIIIPIITAILGGILAGIPSYIGYKMKKMELNHLYEVSRKNSIRESAVKSCKDIYQPLFNILNALQIIVSDNKLDKHQYEFAIMDILMQYRKLLVSEHKIFLTNEIEFLLDTLYWFVDSSLNAENSVVGVYSINYLFGEKSITKLRRNFKSESSARLFIAILEFLESILNIFAPLMFWFDVRKLNRSNYEIFYKSTPLDGEEFKRQVLKYVENAKISIKEIIL